MSIDLHKYGYASKGVSVVAFRDPKLRQLTYVPCADGNEGLYVTPTLQGSRGGAVMAVAWATLLHLGKEGYRASANAIADAQDQLKKFIRTELAPHLVICGDPVCAVLPVCGTNGLNVYSLATLMERRGWSMFTGQKPATLGIPVGDHTPALLPTLMKDLKESTEYLLAHPDFKPEGTAAVYGSAAKIPDDILMAVLRGYVDVKLTVKKKTQNGKGKTNGGAYPSQDASEE